MLDGDVNELDIVYDDDRVEEALANKTVYEEMDMAEPRHEDGGGWWRRLIASTGRGDRAESSLIVVIVMAIAVLFCLSGTCGALLFSSSWVADWYINEDLHTSVDSGVVVDSNHSSGYPSWVSNFNHSHANPLYFNYWLYNLTNLDEVLSGGSPQYDAVGPYVYREYQQKYGVEFSDGGRQVRYNQWNYYRFLANESGSRRQDDVIVGMNAAYTGVIEQAGSEALLVALLSGPALERVFQSMHSTLVPDVLHRSVPDILRDAQAAVQPNLQAFLSVWANSSAAKPPSGPAWDGLYVPGGPTNISAACARALFNASLHGSLLDPEWSSTQRWRLAAQGERNATQHIGSAFGLSMEQVRRVAHQWLSDSFVPVRCVPNVTAVWGVAHPNDLAYVQWGQGSVAGGQSVRELYPSLELPQVPELALWYARNNATFASLSLASSMTLLNGSRGIFQLENMGDLLLTLEKCILPATAMMRGGGECSALIDDWGVDVWDAPLLLPYFTMVNGSFAAELAADVFARGGGLFSARTVHQWLWDFQDPLLAIARGPQDAQGALVGNASLQQTMASQRASVCWTGKHHLGRIGEYIEWRGRTNLTHVYNGTVQVSGTNNQGQFRPWLSRSDVLHTWDDTYVRVVALEPVGEYRKLGVRLLHYTPSNETWAPSSLYVQRVRGFANITGWEGGASVHISNPHMFGADPAYVAKIPGMAALQNASQDVTRVGIEPISGAVVDYREGAQVNVYFAQRGDRYAAYHRHVPSDVFFPVMTATEHAELSPHDARSIKHYLYSPEAARSKVFWALLATGLAIMVCACGGCACLVALLGPRAAAAIPVVARAAHTSDPIAAGRLQHEQGHAYAPLYAQESEE